MAKIVGYVKGIEGDFIAKSKTGETRVLHKGDPVYETDLIYNPSKNRGQNIDIDLISTKNDLKFNGNGMVYLEGSTFDASIPTEDMTLSQADVNSNLRDVKTQSDFVDDILKEYGDIDINETAIGKEEVLPRGHEIDQFAKTDGAIADVNSDLRNVATHSYNLEHDFDPLSSSGESGFSPTHLAQTGSLGPQTPPLPNPTVPTQPYNPPQPAPAPAPAPAPNHQPVIPEVSVNDTSIHEQNGMVVFTLRSSAPIGEDIVIHYTTRDASATNGDDYTSVSGTAVIRGGETQTTIEIPVNDDDITESNENFNILISSISDNARIADGEGIATIIDDRGSDNPNVDEDTTASLIIDDAGTVREADGAYLVYDVKLSNPVGDDIPVSFTTAGTATPTDDYNPQLQYSIDGGNSWINAGTTVDMPADASTVKVRVAINDDYIKESDETVVLSGSSTDERLTDSSDTGTGTIIDDSGTDPIDTVYAKITTDHTTITEDGGDIIYTVSLVDKDGNPVTVPSGASMDVDINWSGTAGIDDTTLSSLSTSVTINSNTNHTDITVPVKDDYLNEGDEPLTATITNVTDTNNTYENTAIATTANGYINDSDVATTTIIDGSNENDHGTDTEDTVYVMVTPDDTVVEGGYLTHTVTLVDKDGNPVSVPSGKSVTVDMSYTDGTGLENGDFRGSRITQVTINGGNSSATIQNLTKDDFIQENDESYTLKILNITDNDNYFENIAAANSANGYVSDSDSVTGTIQNGVTPATPDNAGVDEDDFDIQNNITFIQDTGSLHITSPNESNYTLTFEHGVIAKDDNGNTLALTSDGKAVSYDYSTPGKIVANDSDGDKVFEIILDKDNGNYTYTQYKNLDHPITNSDDNITLSFNYDVNDTDAAGDTYSKTSSFDVVVNDSMPSADPQTVSTDEDTSKIIYISDESFSNGQITLNNGVDGDQTISSGNSIDIYDNQRNDIMGALTNNGDGTLTFSPKPNYSGDTNGFSYNVSDGDGDNASANIAISVKPVADVPIMPDDATLTTGEDFVNTHEGTNTIGLNLSLPSLSDQTDQTDQNGSTSGDAHERFGLIEISFANSNDFGVATLKYDSDGNGTLDTTLMHVTKDTNTFTIGITDVNEYHPTNFTGNYNLTQAQYESLAIVQAEDNANNIIMDIKTKMHEVDDNGDVFNPDIVSNYSTQTVTVDVLAVTDDISLKYNDDQGIGTISSTDDGNSNTDDTANTFTFNTVDEDSSGTVIDLKSILTQVGGTQDDTSPDLDGSEHRSYEFSGLPEGSIITLDGVSTAVASDGTATINFPDNTKADPDFTLKIAPNYSGNIDATLTLKVTDTDSDSTVTPQTKEVTLYLKGDVNPVADDVTIQVKQTVGLEDAGRSAGNTSNDSATASDIDHPENGIPIDVKVTSDDDRRLTGASPDDAETYTVTIDKIPDGASLYIADTDGTYYLYDKNSGNLHNVNVTDNSDATYKVVISSYDNDKLPLFIPPHNSDENYTFDISAYSNDGNTQSVAQTLQVDIGVTGVADIPANTDLHLYDRDGNSSQNGVYAEVVNENEYVDLKKVYQDFTHLNSYDKDGSEALSVVISDLPGGFEVSGKALSLGNGKYVVSKDDLDTVHINFPDGYAGEANFKLTYITTEREGDSKTHFTQDVKVLVTPVAEASLSSDTSVDEDMQTAVHFTFTPQDSNEALQTIYLKKDDVDNKDFTLKLSGNDLSTTEVIDNITYYKINASDKDNLTVQYDSDLGSSLETSIHIKYITTDTVSGLSDGNGDLIDTSDYQDGMVNFTLSPVTDGVSVDISGSANISGAHITANDGTNGEEEVNINDTGDFTTTLDITALATDNSDTDTDGSEKITKLLIENVPDGIIVDNGVRVSGGSEATWIVTPNIAMNADTENYDVTFKVGTELYGGTGIAKDITVTTVDKDGNAQEVKADTKVKFIDNIDNGNGGSTDTVSADLHIDHPEIVEDTTFYLGDFIKVDTDPNDGAGDNSHDDATYSISITNLQGFSFVDPSSTISYTDSNGDTVYVISGDESSINSALQRTAVIPDENLNSNNIGNASLNADITLNAYMFGAYSHQVTSTYNETSVTPVTDDLTQIDMTGAIDEDSSGYGFDITFDSVDKPHYTISNVILHTDDTTLGTLKLSDGTVVNFDSNGNASIDSSKLTGLMFIPATDISGQAVFTYKADVQENGASNTLTSIDGGSITIDINPVVDGLELSNLAASGDEHYIHNGTESNNFIELTGIGTSGDGDGSESVKSITIDNVPDGFLVYYGGSGSETMALNAGDNGSGSTFDLNGAQVGYNIWAIPVNGGAMPNIYITPPQNWSGEVTNITLNVTNSDGSATAIQTQTFDLDISPVANDITASATKTFGSEGEDIPLNLNANAEDLDGSESVILTLKGFGDDKATFKVSGEPVDSSHVSYDTNNDTYTITDINTKDINDVSVVHTSVSNATIDFTLQTVDSATINGVAQTDTLSSTISGSFNINITESIPSSGDDILLYKGNTVDALGGNDTLVLNGETIDFSNVKNVETIDLNAGDNSVTNLSLSDVVDMTDSNNNLTINGDSADNVTLGGGGWSQSASVSENGHTYDVYTNSGDSTVTLKIEDHITVS